jgi:hypothetical protein
MPSDNTADGQLRELQVFPAIRNTVEQGTTIASEYKANPLQVIEPIVVKPYAQNDGNGYQQSADDISSLNESQIMIETDPPVSRLVCTYC